MKNQLECRTLRKENQLLVENFVNSNQRRPESPEDIFLLWKSSFREESLAHYLALNWCFGCFKGEVLVGVVLQQPLLFWNGLTQVLWVEGVESSNSEVFRLLLETSYKTAREKHLQVLAFSEKQDWEEDLNLVGLKVEVSKSNVMVKTASWA